MEEICVLIAQKKRKGFKRYDYTRRNIKEFETVLDIFTIYCPKSAFTGRRVKKITSKYKSVYTSDIALKKYAKRKEESILNFLPSLSAKAIAEQFDFDLSKEIVGIVIKSRRFVNINFLSRLLKNVKYISIYNSSSEINNIFMEATGICAVNGKSYNERFTIILDDSVSFCINGEIFTDAVFSTHPLFDDKDFPATEILKDLLKRPDGEKIMKKAGIDIINLIWLDKTD